MGVCVRMAVDSIMFHAKLGQIIIGNTHPILCSTAVYKSNRADLTSFIPKKSDIPFIIVELMHKIICA